MVRHWIAVASAGHVARGRAGGFMQVCHGKAAPLRRIAPGDGVIYYSPTHEFRGKERLQAFTAIGTVAPGEPYQVDMGEGFEPWRRDVLWQPACDVPISPLLERLSFTHGQRNWGYRFRFGLFEIDLSDHRLIREIMCGTILDQPSNIAIAGKT